MTGHLTLIDGSGFIFRAYHSLPPLTRKDGTPVGAVYGFVNMLLKLMEERRKACDGEYLAVVFDVSRVTFRNRLYSEYKAHRPPAPEDLVPQFPLIREATAALNLPVIEREDFEADDLIATYAALARAQGMTVTIVSSDKDLMQLIGDGVAMLDPMKNRPIGAEQVREKFGVGPEKVIEVLALIGDSSDNVPGVPGIGPKTAAELIEAYGDVENLLAHAGEIKQPKRREVLQSHAAQARLSRELVLLRHDVPLPLPLDALELKPLDAERLAVFLEAQNFTSLVTRVRSKWGGGTAVEAAVGGQVSPPSNSATQAGEGGIRTDGYALVREEAQLAGWVAAARAAGAVAFDTETTGLDATRAELVGFSLAVAPGNACYVPLAHQVRGAAQQTNLFGDATQETATALMRAEGQIPLERALALIKPLLEDPAVMKIGHNIKYDMLVLAKYGLTIAPVEDTMLLSYVLAAGAHAHNMDEVSRRYLGHTPIAYDEVTGTGRARVSFAEVALEKACVYAAEDADVTLRLCQLLKPMAMQERLLGVYDTLERPLIPVLVAMEEAGILVDRAQLAALSLDFAQRMAALEEQLHRLAGRVFNVGSPKQLGEVLFDELKLPGGKRNAKSGTYNTSAEVLEELAPMHELPKKLLEWRQLSKLKSTYADALQAQIHPQTGRVHTSFAMAVASTGRLSSSDPNLQNIPIRSEEGKKIRHAFVAPPGMQLISADYSQIELRLLAHVADIAVLKDAFRDGKDIHAITASQMFDVPLAEVNGDLRRKAKTINFGIIYGISAHGLAARLGIGRGEAADYIKRYFAQYPGIEAYMERTKEEARAHGYVTTLFGRRCHLPGIRDKNPNMRAFSERAAINAPLQGTAADIIKRAMITIHRAIRQGEIPARMLLQVHDELVFEAAGDASIAAERVKTLMEQAAELSVPLTVETGVGANWGEIH